LDNNYFKTYSEPIEISSLLLNILLAKVVKLKPFFKKWIGIFLEGRPRLNLRHWLFLVQGLKQFGKPR